jgi:hypothetical protein
VLDGADEATELGRRIATAFPDAGSDQAGLTELRAYLDELAANRQALLATVEDPALLAEIAPWSEKLTALAGAGIAGLDALAGAGDAARYRAARDAAIAPPEAVAQTLSNSGLAVLAGGVVNPPVDRFADLFAAIDARLGGS